MQIPSKVTLSACFNVKYSLAGCDFGVHMGGRGVPLYIYGGYPGGGPPLYIHGGYRHTCSTGVLRVRWCNTLIQGGVPRGVPSIYIWGGGGGSPSIYIWGGEGGGPSIYIWGEGGPPLYIWGGPPLYIYGGPPLYREGHPPPPTPPGGVPPWINVLHHRTPSTPVLHV